MKLLLTTIAVVLVVGCGESQQSSTPVEAKPEPPAAEAPDISIHDAVEKGNVEAIKQQLAAGADVNVKDKSGSTPLHLAAEFGHKEVSELLITKGADVNAKLLGGHLKGMTPLDYATHPDNPNASAETADLLRKHGGKSGANDSIHVATSLGKIEAVKQHIAAGADVNAKDKYGRTPLHKATVEGHKYVVELFIAKGANVNAKDRKGGTPLDRVRSSKHPEIAALLRKHGGKTGEELKAEGK